MEFVALAVVFDSLEKTASRLEMTSQLAVLLKGVKASEIRHVIYLCQGIVLPPFTGVELGMGDKLCEQSVSLVVGKTKKEIEALYRKEGDLSLAVEKLLEKKIQRTLRSQVLSAEKVYQNFYKIATASGSGSQDLKIKMLAELLSNASPLEGRVIVRFVTGRMRLGVGDATLVDALSYVQKGDKSCREVIERAYNLRSDLGGVAEILYRDGLPAVERLAPAPFNPIRPALAERLNTATDIVEKLGECAVEGKFDGFRVQVHVQGKKVEIYSRRQERVTPMFPDLVAGIQKQLSAKDAILEGEAIAYSEETGTFLPFQETMQRKRKHGVAEKASELPLKLFCFELLELDGEDYTRKPYRERRAKLAKLLRNGDVIELAPSLNCKTAEQLQKVFDESVAAGLEGIVAKDLSAPYVAGGRKFAWIKLKKSYAGELADTLDLVILGFYYGKGKRTEFGLGGLLTGVYDDENNRFKTLAKIGTGFSEKDLAAFREELDKLKTKTKPASVDSVLEPDEWVQPKIVVTIKADELTRSPTHTAARRGDEGLALRFPRITGRRDDKAARDATTEKEVLELYELQEQRRKSSTTLASHAEEKE